MKVNRGVSLMKRNTMGQHDVFFHQSATAEACENVGVNNFRCLSPCTVCAERCMGYIGWGCSQKKCNTTSVANTLTRTTQTHATLTPESIYAIKWLLYSATSHTYSTSNNSPSNPAGVTHCITPTIATPHVRCTHVLDTLLWGVDTVLHIICTYTSLARAHV